MNIVIQHNFLYTLTKYTCLMLGLLCLTYLISCSQEGDSTEDANQKEPSKDFAPENLQNKCLGFCLKKGATYTNVYVTPSTVTVAKINDGSGSFAYQKLSSSEAKLHIIYQMQSVTYEVLVDFKFFSEAKGSVTKWEIRRSDGVASRSGSGSDCALLKSAPVSTSPMWHIVAMVNTSCLLGDTMGSKCADKYCPNYGNYPSQWIYGNKLPM